MSFDSDLADYERKVEAVCKFARDALPSPDVDIPESAFRMDLHRSLMRSTGFYDTLCKEIKSGNDTEDLSCMLADTFLAEPQRLPVLNFLDIVHKEYADALVAEALPQDRERFRAYLSDRPLALGLIASPVCDLSTNRT